MTHGYARLFHLVVLILATSCAAGEAVPRGSGQALETVDLRPPAPPAGPDTLPPLPVGAAVERLYGELVIDRFRWLEDEKSERARTWNAEHNRQTREKLDKLPRRQALERRLYELYYLDTRSVPVRRGERLFFSRKAKNQEKAVHYFQETETGTATVLLDPNLMSPDGSLSVKGVTPSKDGRYIVYFESPNNADESTLQVMEVATRKVLMADCIPGLRYTQPSWTRDNKGFFYTWRPRDPALGENERSANAEVRYHKLGSDPAADIVVHEKTGDASRWQGVWLSEDGEYLFLSIGRGWSQNDLYVKHYGKSGLAQDWQPLAESLEGTFDAFAYRDVIYVLSNYRAPNARLYRVNPKQPLPEHWQIVLPERADAVLEDARVVSGKLGARYQKNAATELELFELDGKSIGIIPLPTLGTASALEGNEDNDVAYFEFSSFTRPSEIYRTSIRGGATTLFSKVEAPIDPERFVVRQEWYASKDGTKVSILLVYSKDVSKDGKNPTLLHGYGGFNISMTPRFDAKIYPWLEAGGVYALANIRGGGEYGEAWHRAGMLANKQNVFDDFIAAAEWLIEQKFTDRDHLGIIGASNGGLLVGATLTQRPDLFGAVVCGAPLLDMLRFHLFGIGKAWIPEYGNPENAADFGWLKAYSPYHHLQERVRYPALLVLTADTDDRVDPMHARKFVARLEELRRNTGPATLIRIESNAGHGGGDLRKKALAEGVDQLAFLMNELMPTQAPQKN